MCLFLDTLLLSLSPSRPSQGGVCWPPSFRVDWRFTDGAGGPYPLPKLPNGICCVCAHRWTWAWFCLSAIMNKAALSCLHTPLTPDVQELLKPRSGCPGCGVLPLLGNPKAVSGWFHQSCTRAPVTPHPLLDCSCFLIFANFVATKWCLLVVLIC